MRPSAERPLPHFVTDRGGGSSLPPRPWGSRVAIGDALSSDYVSDDFGSWFAGLVDGEGCFYIGETGCTFTIKMRADDAPMLRRARSRLGDPGRIRFGNLDSEGPRRPQVSFVVSQKAQCVWLTLLFDAFPLQSKKARDYEVWREAVIGWQCGAPRAEFARYRALLEQARAYDHELVLRELADVVEQELAA